MKLATLHSRLMRSQIPLNKEQVVVCLRWVDAQFQAHEDFIGLHHVADITSATIVRVLKDTILRLNLSLSMCRAQCYDGASNMKKVASEIKPLSQQHCTCTALPIV